MSRSFLRFPSFPSFRRGFLKATFSNKIISIKLLENHLLSFLKTETSENELHEIARRDDKNTMIFTKIEHV